MKTQNHSTVRITLCMVCLMMGAALGCTESGPGETRHEATGPEVPGDVGEMIGEMETASEEISVLVDKTFRSIHAGKATSLYHSATSPKFREVASLEDFQGLCEGLNARLGALTSMRSTQFNLNPSPHGPSASAAYEAKFEHGSGTILVHFERAEDQWLLLTLRVNSPELLANPDQFTQRVEVYVEESDPVMPGTVVNLWDENAQPRQLLVEDAPIIYARWKVDKPLSSVRFPARGFLTFGLTPEQSKKIKGKRISARRSANTKSSIGGSHITD